MQTLRPKDWEAKRGKEAWKVGKCTSANRWVEAPGSQACTCSSTGWSCHTAHHPPRRGKERTLGLGFRAVRFSDADWLRGWTEKKLALSGDFLCVPPRGPSLAWSATQALGEGTVGTQLVSLSCLGPRLPSLLPGSFLPGTPVPPCLPRLLHRSRFPTAHHLAFRQLREFDQSMLEETWNHRSLGRTSLALFQAQMRRQSAPKKPSQTVFLQQGHLNLSSTPVTSGRAFPEAARSLGR